MLHQKRQCVCAMHIICLINYANTFCQLVLGNCQCDFSHRSTNKTVTSAESQTDLLAFERCSQQSTGSCFGNFCCCCSCCCCHPSATFSAGAKASGILWRIRVFVCVCTYWICDFIDYPPSEPRIASGSSTVIDAVQQFAASLVSCERQTAFCIRSLR